MKWNFLKTQIKKQNIYANHMALLLGFYNVNQNGEKTNWSQNLLTAAFPHNRYKDNTAMN